jgi:hypothetical protein
MTGKGFGRDADPVGKGGNGIQLDGILKDKTSAMEVKGSGVWGEKVPSPQRAPCWTGPLVTFALHT